MRDRYIKITWLAGYVLFFLAACAGTPAPDTAYGRITVTVQAQQDRDVIFANEEQDEEQYGGGSARSAGDTRYDYAKLSGLVVSLQSLTNHGQTKPETVVMVLQGNHFQSSLLVAAQGQVVRVVNHSAQPARFYAYLEALDQTFSWPDVAPGDSVDWFVEQAGLVQLYVEHIPQAEASLYFTPGDDAVMLDSADQYTFTRLPAGTYRVMGWHEFLPSEKKTITVAAGQHVTIDLLFSVDMMASEP